VGGEEFLVVLPELDLHSARLRAENLLACIHATDISDVAPQLPPLTASIGVTVSQRGDCTHTLLQRADAALYCAKAAGRDRVLTDTQGK
jgi:diguanylate cyclase (GGDEF)-like protein